MATNFNNKTKPLDGAAKSNRWKTVITKVEPNNLVICGYPLSQLIEHSNLLETAHLLIKQELPVPEELAQYRETAFKACRLPAPKVERFEGQDISMTLGNCLLSDKTLFTFPQSGDHGPVNKTIFTLGRFCRYLACLLKNEAALDRARADEPFGNMIYRSLTGERTVDPKKGRLIEAMVTACVDHGVTPPSAQAGIIAASVRTDYAMSLCSGVGAITDIHGGAGRKAAEFFTKVVARTEVGNLSLEDATEAVIREYRENKMRIQGLGHRVHSEDPRRNVLWQLAKASGFAGRCVRVSEIVSGIFTKISGKHLPINVDGVIGAIIVDLGVDIDLAKIVFIFGRVAGLSAHYFEEIRTQRPMRKIDFNEAVYVGMADRDYPKS